MPKTKKISVTFFSGYCTYEKIFKTPATWFTMTITSVKETSQSFTDR